LYIFSAFLLASSSCAGGRRAQRAREASSQQTGFSLERGAFAPLDSASGGDGEQRVAGGDASAAARLGEDLLLRSQHHALFGQDAYRRARVADRLYCVFNLQGGAEGEV
jgi:hypothetical protein